MHIRLLNTDDWVGLYIDKELVMEGHSLSIDRVLRFCLPNSDIKSVWNFDEGFWESGHCPRTYLDEYDEFE